MSKPKRRDGHERWFSSGLVLLVIALSSCGSPSQPTSFGISCPASQALASPDGNPVTITYAPPAISGGQAPIASSCSPASGTPFPLGATLITCKAEDAKHLSASCTFEVQIRAAPPKPPQLSATRFVAFGDSMTDGFEHTCTSIEMLFWADPSRDPEGLRPPPDSPISYPNKLRSLLSARYLGQTFSVINEGSGGEVVADGAADVPRVLTQDNPQVLLVQEGANDVNQGHSPASIATSLRSMVREAKNRGVQPYVGTLLPMRPGSCRGVAADGVPPANDQIRSMAASEGVPLVDLYQAFGAIPGTLIGPDGLHPTEAGYQKMADTFFDAIRQRLEN